MSIANVEISALAVAASAIGGRVSPRDVAVLRGLAAEALPPDDALRREIEAFARARPMHQHDRARMGRLGKRLGRAVELGRDARAANV